MKVQAKNYFFGFVPAKQKELLETRSVLHAKIIRIKVFYAHVTNKVTSYHLQTTEGSVLTHQKVDTKPENCETLVNVDVCTFGLQ